MAGFGTFLAALAGPIAKKALTALGVGVISYAAVSTALQAALAAAKAAWGAFGGGGVSEALALVQMAGIPTAASIYAGALVANVALEFGKRIGKLN